MAVFHSATAHADAWSEAEATRQKVATLRKTDPPAAADLLENELDKVQNANVAADFFTLLGDVYTTSLKAPDKALATFDRALPIFQKPEYKVPAYHYLTMIAAKANALTALKKGAEAEALMKEHWPMLLQSLQTENPYGSRAARDATQSYKDALKAQGKDAEVTPLLGRVLGAAPQYLNPSSGDSHAWIQGELVARLQKEGRAEDALGWAKLAYQICAFDKGDIERATLNLGKIWAAQENFAALGQFNRAQSDAAAPNPLAKIPSPLLSDETKAHLKKFVADLEGRQIAGFSRDRAKLIIKAYIVLGTPEDLRSAMGVATKLLKEHPEWQDGSLLVCRVFKAADLNLLRANAFLSYLAGEGPSPLPEFLNPPATPAVP